MNISNDAVPVLWAVGSIIEMGVFYYCKVQLLSIVGLKSLCSLSTPRARVGHLFMVLRLLLRFVAWAKVDFKAVVWGVAGEGAQRYCLIEQV